MALLGLGAQVGVLLPFSRAQEREADVLGLALKRHCRARGSSTARRLHRAGNPSVASPDRLHETVEICDGERPHQRGCLRRRSAARAAVPPRLHRLRRSTPSPAPGMKQGA